jgi:hypothetical protein
MTFLKLNHNYIKIRADSVHNVVCYVGLRQCNLAAHCKNLLDLLLANFSDIGDGINDIGFIVPDIYHSSPVTDLSII